MMTRKELAKKAFNDLKTRCSVKSARDITLHAQEGYWRSVDPVPSDNIDKSKPYSYAEDENGNYYHVYHFAEYGARDKGKFASPYRAWSAWKGLKKAGKLSSIDG